METVLIADDEKNIREGIKCIIDFILSGYSDFKYAQTAIRLGVDNYITKPIDEDELTEAVCCIGEEIKTARENE